MVFDFLLIWLSCTLKLGISESNNSNDNTSMKYSKGIFENLFRGNNIQDFEGPNKFNFKETLVKNHSKIEEKMLPVFLNPQDNSNEESKKLWDVDTQWIKSVLSTHLPIVAIQNYTQNIYNNATVLARRQFSCPLRPPADEWLHCQDLITPFLMGIRKNITVTKHVKIDSKDRDVFKLLSLFKFNTTGAFNVEELKAYMFKISKFQIRLFQWSVNAIKLLLDSIIKERMHTFRNLKFGIKKLLGKWNVDYSDTAVLLNYTSLFKPMCVTYVNYKGSTSSLKAKRFPKTETTKPTKVCDAVCMARMARNREKKKRTF